MSLDTVEGRVTVIGSVNQDVSFFLERLPLPGETLISHDRLVGIGGKGANQAIAAVSQGVSVEFLGAVGNDEPGAQALYALERSGVSTKSCIVSQSEATGSAVISVAQTGENTIIVASGANATLKVADVLRALENSSSSVCLAQLEVPISVVEAASKSFAGTFILNPAPFRDLQALQEVLAHTDVFVPNRAELAGVVGTAEPRTIEEVTYAARKLPFDRSVLVTLGADGVLLFEESPQSEPVYLAAEKVDAVDTSGAGDVFCGVFAAGLARGRSLKNSADHANRLAGWSVTQRGAQLAENLPDQFLLSE